MPPASSDSLTHAVAIKPTADDEAYLDFLAENLASQHYGNNLAQRLAAKMAERLPTLQGNPQQMGELLGKQLAHMPQMQQRIHLLTARFAHQQQAPAAEAPVMDEVLLPQAQEAVAA